MIFYSRFKILRCLWSESSDISYTHGVSVRLPLKILLEKMIRMSAYSLMQLLKVRYELDILLWGLIMTKPSNLYLEAGLAVEEHATTSVCEFLGVWRYPIYYALGLDQCKKIFGTWLYPVVES